MMVFRKSFFRHILCQKDTVLQNAHVNSYHHDELYILRDYWYNELIDR
jgi:hypothetical protein